MGLPGSGKTYLAKRMQPILKAAWYNADIVREMANDWDFSPEGRIRQSLRMKNLADFEKSQGRIVICDGGTRSIKIGRMVNGKLEIEMVIGNGILNKNT